MNTSTKYQNETVFIFSDDFNKSGYTVIQNHILTDENISYYALGIYCQIIKFQHSKNHKIYIKGLANLRKESRNHEDLVSAGLKELVEQGYLKREKITDNEGNFLGVRYIVYTKPHKKTVPNHYQEYLKTNHWKDVKKKALQRADYKCQLCNKQNLPLHVHHNNYENLGHEKDSDLIVLCKTCHEKYHNIQPCFEENLYYGE